MGVVIDLRTEIQDGLFAFLTEGKELILSTGSGDTTEQSHQNYKEVFRFSPDGAEKLL